MIISHRKKFAFFASQKTGSKAVGIALRLSGIFDENDIMIAQPFLATRTAKINLPEYNLGDHQTHLVNHFRPSDAIEAGFITLEQLREYDCYAFLRDPKERWLASRMAMQVNRYGMIATPTRKRVSGVAPPQHTFFFVDGEQVVSPLDFDNYEQELRAMLKRLGGYEHIDVPQIKEVFPGNLVNDVVYKPYQHTKDIKFYEEFKCDSLLENLHDT
jgi:hypothetical protein